MGRRSCLRRTFASHGENDCVPDDVEQMLSGLEQRLRALQAELDAPDDAPNVAGSAHTAPPATFAEALEGLEAFREDLHRLVERFDRLVGGEGLVFRGDVLLEAETDLTGIA